jgi:PKD domain
LLTTGTAAAANCTLPTQQQLATAQSIMHGEKAVQFPIVRYPALGTVTIEIFIRAKEIWVNPGFEVSIKPVGPARYPYLDVNGHPTLAARYDSAFDFPGLFLQGDGRDWDLNFSPDKTRAFAVLDFAAGTGYFIVNKSVSKFRAGVGPLSYTFHESWEARNTYRQWGGANNWFYGDWISASTYRFRTHIKEAAFGTSWVAPAIDAQIEINKDTGQAVVRGDTFPTVAVHQPTACRTLTVRPENNPGDLYAYEAPDAISPGRPIDGAPGVASPGPVSPAANQAPVASYSYSRLAGAGNIVALDGRASRDPDGHIVQWQWIVESAVVATGPTPTIRFGAATSKQLTLKVTDDKGASGSISRTLSLPNRAPVVTAVSPGKGSIAGSNTPQLSAIAKDNDGDAMQYIYHITGPHVDLTSGWVSGGWVVPAHKLDPGTSYQWDVTVRDNRGGTAKSTQTFQVANLPSASDVITTSDGAGYWQVATDGGVFSYGTAQFYGSVPGLGLHLTNILGMARTPTNAGYWLVGSDGGVFAFGDAQFFGSLPGLQVHVNNIVGMTPTRTGNGYWLVGSDGGVFAFGDAQFYGSMGGKPLNKPVVSIAATPDSGGYWLAAQDGGIFAFGNAGFYGSMGGQPLNLPVTDMDATPDGHGYWMAAEDGGVFAFGNAQFYGSMAGKPLNGHVTGMSVTQDGQGYFLNGCDGGVFAFGNASFRGSNPTYGCRGV